MRLDRRYRARRWPPTPGASTTGTSTCAVSGTPRPPRRAPPCGRPWTRRRRPAPRAVASAVGRAGRGGGAAAGSVRAAPRGRHRGPGRGGPAPRPAHRLPRPAPARRRPDDPADRHRRAAATCPTTSGRGSSRSSCPPAGRRRAGASATSPTCARSAPGPRAGAPGMLAVSPLHAPLPLDRVEPSPYFPSSRRWRNPLALRIEDVPGAAGDPGRGGAGRARAAGSTTARSSTATRCGRSSGGRSSRCGRPAGPTCGSTGGARRWAPTSRPTPAFCALAEHHGSGWHGVARGAPPPRSPGGGGVRGGRPPTGSRSGRGCSSCSTTSSGGPRSRCPCSPTSPSASIPTGPTPG